MASVPQEISGGVRTRAGYDEVLVPIIADGGDAASVVLVGFARQPRVGDRFQLCGRDWEITREKDHVRTYVARPVRRRR